MTKKPRIEDLSDMYQKPQSQSDLEDRIRARAYEIYLDREGSEGSELDDWLRAEREIKQQSREERKDGAASMSTAIA